MNRLRASTDRAKRKAEKDLLAAATRFVKMWEKTEFNWMRLDSDYLAMVRAIVALERRRAK